jgi:ubiquinone/menaquinone biosynthesis C-methylase UbiE
VAALAQRGPDDNEVAKFLALAELKPDQSVAEIGAGAGKLTIAVARAVGPNGRVFSTEIDEKRIAQIQAAAEKEKLANITVLRGAEDATNLPPGCCDLVFMRTVYHHFTKPEAINRDLYRAVRAGGRLIVIDFTPRQSSEKHGVAPETIVTQTAAAGFQHERTIQPWVGRNYAVVVRKPAE